MMLSPALFSSLKPHLPSSPRQQGALRFRPLPIKASSLPTPNPPPSFRKPSSVARAATRSKDGGSSRAPLWMISGAASLGLALLLLGIDGKEALALGPPDGGPLVEEFWDNMRRYVLYVLTVSTGVVSAIAEPILDLLRNPVTAVIIILIVVSGGYLLSQVLSLMVGVADFSYDYAN